jgi:hypothetical protein
MIDAVEALSNEQLYQLAVDVQVQLEQGSGTRPVLWLLAQQRAKASVAMMKLVEVDASETQAIRALQNEVRLYGDLVEACQSLILRGREADSLINESDRSDMSEIIGDMSPEDRRLHGFEQQGDE